MASLNQGANVQITINAGEVYRVYTYGSAEIDVLSYLNFTSTTQTINLSGANNSYDFGPYERATKINVMSLSGVTQYNLLPSNLKPLMVGSINGITTNTINPDGSFSSIAGAKWMQCTGQIRPNNRILTTSKQFIMRKRLVIGKGGANYVSARFPNYVAVNNNNGLETGPGAASTIKAYLIVGGTPSGGAIVGGKAYKVTWGGVDNFVVADKAYTDAHDPIPVFLPEDGVIWYQISFENAAGIIYEDGNSGAESLDVTNGEIFRTAASGLDITQISSMGAWSGGTNNTATGYNPACVLTKRPANWTNPVVLYVGTSIDMGLRSSANGGGDKGILARALRAAKIPYICVAQGGSSMLQWSDINNRALRIQMEQYCNLNFTGHMINDLLESGAVTATVIQSRFATHLATFANPTFNATCTPRSTGAWTLADGSDQTAYDVSSFDSRRTASNNNVRLGTPGYAGYFDYAAATYLSSSAQNKWYADGTTNYMFQPYSAPDGLHPGTQGETFATARGIFNVGILVPYF